MTISASTRLVISAAGEYGFLPAFEDSGDSLQRICADGAHASISGCGIDGNTGLIPAALTAACCWELRSSDDSLLAGGETASVSAAIIAIEGARIRWIESLGDSDVDGAPADQPLDPPGYAARVHAYEIAGMTRSDAQGCVDIEMRGPTLRPPLPRSAIKVSSSAYEFAHGKKPRGFGSWAFFIGDSPSDTPPPSWHFFNQMCYGAAKRAAINLAAARGLRYIVVAS